MQKIKVKGIYKHFKGDFYIVEDVAIHMLYIEHYMVSKNYI